MMKKVFILSAALLIFLSCLFGCSASADITELTGKNWMSGIPDDRYIYEFNIPGTHDSGTKNVWNELWKWVPVPTPLFPVIPVLIPIYMDIAPFLKAFARCQDLSISEQLDIGVRAFDLRITNYVKDTGLPSGTMLIAHGQGELCYRCQYDDDSYVTLRSVLDTMRQFLKDHPSEALVVSVKCENEDSNYPKVWPGIKEILQDYSDILYMKNEWPKLGDVRGKAVLVSTSTALGLDAIIIDPGDTQETVNCSKTTDINPVQLFYENHWDYGRGDKSSYVSTYLKQLDQTLQRSGDPHLPLASMLYSSANLITTDWKTILWDVALAYYIGDTTIYGDWQWPRFIADRINPEVTDFIDSAPNDRYFGFVMTDFAGETAETVWKSNFPYYQNYRIRYINMDGELLHEDMIEPGKTTTTFQGFAWRDTETGATYQGKFTPAGDMTLQANVYVLRFRNDQPVGAINYWPEDIYFIPNPTSSVDVNIPVDVPEAVGSTYTFKEWNTQKDGGGDRYSPGAAVSADSDLTLWAQWTFDMNKWSVLYDANGGTQAPATEVYLSWQDGTVSYEIPLRGDMVFMGWTTNPDSPAVEYQPGDTIPYKPLQNQVILYALWEFGPVERPIMITFDANGLEGASLLVDKLPLPHGSSVKLPYAYPPLGSKYVFSGWSEDPASRLPSYLPDQEYSFNEDTTLYAIWKEADTVTLTFMDPLPDAASGIPDPISIVPSMSRDIRIPDNIPQKSGRVFTGWNTEKDGIGTQYAPGSVITLQGDMTLWAQWDIAGNSWYVVYNANGGTWAPKPQIVPKGQNAVLTDELPASGSMIFKGWTTNPSVPAAEYQPGDTLPYDSGKDMVVLYALWNLDPAQRPVHISFKANGAEGAAIPPDVWMERDSWYQLPYAVAPLGSAYAFRGWSENPDATDPEYLAGNTYYFSQNITLYAIWGQLGTVTLTFRDSLPGDASGIPDPISIVPSMSRNVRIPDTIPQKSGRVFTGWNTEKDGKGTYYAPGSVITLQGDMTLWAQWDIAGNSWYVVYNANGGTWAPKPQIVPKGQNAVLTDELPASGSMIFKGWTTNPSVPAAEYQPGDTLKYDSGKNYVVLYALWDLDPAHRPVVISFDANGGLPDTVPKKISAPQGTWVQLPAQQPSWDAQHDFLGWSKDPKATEPEWKPGSAVLFTQDTTLYAIWNAHYKVIEGAGSVWTKGSGKPQRFVADGNVKYFKELRVDGRPFNEGVKISSGSTVADISAKAMEKLSVGEHTVTFIYVDGEASASFTVQKKLPPTGDTGHPVLWLGLIMLGILGIVLWGRKRKIKAED